MNKFRMKHEVTSDGLYYWLRADYNYEKTPRFDGPGYIHPTGFEKYYLGDHYQDNAETTIRMGTAIEIEIDSDGTVLLKKEQMELL